MQNLPIYITIFFILTSCLTVYLFYRAANKSSITLFAILMWLIVQAIISMKKFYTVTNVVPPRFLLLIAPPVLCIVVLFITRKGRIFIDNLNIKTLTLLHVVRIAVEAVLYWLFLHKAVPQLMTFVGRNFDILSGLSAPLIYYFGFIKKSINRKILILWNCVCLLLLINIVINAILSAPFPFQKFGFDQPNIAILYFPFTWLPCCIVPIVLLSHLVSIRQLLKKKHTESLL